MTKTTINTVGQQRLNTTPQHLCCPLARARTSKIEEAVFGCEIGIHPNSVFTLNPGHSVHTHTHTHTRTHAHTHTRTHAHTHTRAHTHAHTHTHTHAPGGAHTRQEKTIQAGSAMAESSDADDDLDEVPIRLWVNKQMVLSLCTRAVHSDPHQPALPCLASHTPPHTASCTTLRKAGMRRCCSSSSLKKGRP